MSRYHGKYLADIKGIENLLGLIESTDTTIQEKINYGLHVTNELVRLAVCIRTVAQERKALECSFKPVN